MVRLLEDKLLQLDSRELEDNRMQVDNLVQLGSRVLDLQELVDNQELDLQVQEDNRELEDILVQVGNLELGQEQDIQTLGDNRVQVGMEMYPTKTKNTNYQTMNPVRNKKSYLSWHLLAEIRFRAVAVVDFRKDLDTFWNDFKRLVELTG